MKRAVVLGSGGGVGGGWEVGVLKGLTEAGIDVAEAELFVGSSVGATICAQVRAFGVQHAYEARLAGPGMPRPDQPRGCDIGAYERQ